jgi:hypothetical protein
MYFATCLVIKQPKEVDIAVTLKKTTCTSKLMRSNGAS